MTNRARRGRLLAWLPRTILIATAILAPVIDRGDRDAEPTARGGVPQVEAPEHAPA